MHFNLTYRQVRRLYFASLWTFLGILISQYAPLGLRAVAYDTFRIPTQSMEPTLRPGDNVIVNKLIFGARWYSDLDSINSSNPQTTRLAGYRTLKYNDIVVFNKPTPYDYKIEFKINYVYCKRCVGLAGDTLYIINGYYKNSNCSSQLGYMPSQNQLKHTPASEIAAYNTFPYHSAYSWNVKDFGPLYIPRQNETVVLDTLNYILYKMPIEYETGGLLERDGGSVMLNGQPINSYTFIENYYFMAGDNVLDSEDSRYWGFVPEKHIVGVVTHILNASKDGKWDWSRVMKRLE